MRRLRKIVAFGVVFGGVLAVKTDSPARSAAALIEHAKANAGKLSYA